MAKRRKRYKQTGTTHIPIDKMIQAKKPGWRKSRSGKKYFENRKNRSDKDKWL